MKPVDRRNNDIIYKEIKSSVLRLEDKIDGVKSSINQLEIATATTNVSLINSQQEIIDCKIFRKNITDKTDQVNKDMNRLKTRQDGILKVAWLFGLGLVGIITRLVYKLFH
jgi:chromosome segregation ATPase